MGCRAPHTRGVVITVNQGQPPADSAGKGPRPMTPEEAEEFSKEDFDPAEVAEVIRRRREKEEREARELFGDKEPFPIPDSDTDS